MKDREHADRLSVLIALRATGEAGAAAVANLCEWPRAKAEAVLEELVELERGLVVVMRRPEGTLWRLGDWAQKPTPAKRTLPASRESKKEEAANG